MGCHFMRIARIFWLLLLLDYAAAVSQTLSPSTYNPSTSAWSMANGQYTSSQSGEGAYLDFVFNTNGEGYTAVSVDAYGYTGSSTSPTPASYTIQVNSVNNVYGAGQQQPVVFNNLVPTYNYRIVIWAPSSATGVIINSVVASRADSPTSSTPTHSTTSSLPPSSAVIASTIQTSSSAASSFLSTFSSLTTSTNTSVGTAISNATSTERQSLGVSILVTVSGSVITEESQPTALLSSSSSSSSSPPLGIVIGPIAGAIVIVILAVIIYLRRRDQARRKREQDEVGSYFGGEEAQQPTTSGELDMVGHSPIISEKSRYPYQVFDQGGRTPSRHMPSVPYTASTIESSFTSGVDDESVAPPRAYSRGIAL